MNLKPIQIKLPTQIAKCFVAVLCALSLAPGDSPIFAHPTSWRGASTGQAAPLIPNDQLDSLVAPIALYPDPLLSQVLVASTYPLEIIQLQQWLERHKDLQGEALVAAVEKEDWDPSIQSMAALPDALKQLGENIKWTTDLGNAFLAQQSDVMDAVQRMRMKAMNAGNLKSDKEMKVETKVVETKTVVIVQQTNPQVVYVPWYNPVVVYGPPVYMYPYPPIYYPPPGYYAAGVVIGFGVGVAVGAYYRGGWGYNCGWGRHTTININVNNRYVSHYNKTNVNINRTNINTVNRNGNTWQHNPQHRGGAPYPNKQVATTYGGTVRGESAATRQANARQQQAVSNRQQPARSNFGASSANRPTPSAGANPSNLSGSAGNRVGSNSGARANTTGGGAATRDGSNAAARPSSGGTNRASDAGNRIGNREVQGNSPSGNLAGFGGASNKANAQASSARGAASLGGSRSGGTRSGSAPRPRPA